MNKSSIKSIIQNKVDHWLKSIDDKGLREEVEENVIVTGGAIVSMLLDEEVKDYDIYFVDKEVAEKLAKYYAKKCNSFDVGFPEGFGGEDGIREERVYLNPKADVGTQKIKKDWPEGSKYNPVFVSNNALTLQNDIQLVFRFTGKPEDIHKNYDFVHCTSYWHQGELILPQEALESILTKELRYVGSKYPICSMIRIRKYVERGFSINAGECFKIAWQINELDLNDVKVLREQLTGVDVMYFNKLIEELEDKKDDEDFELDYHWVYETINKIFE